MADNFSHKEVTLINMQQLQSINVAAKILKDSDTVPLEHSIEEKENMYGHCTYVSVDR